MSNQSQSNLQLLWAKHKIEIIAVAAVVTVLLAIAAVLQYSGPEATTSTLPTAPAPPSTSVVVSSGGGDTSIIVTALGVLGFVFVILILILLLIVKRYETLAKRYLEITSNSLPLLVRIDSCLTSIMSPMDQQPTAGIENEKEVKSSASVDTVIPEELGPATKKKSKKKSKKSIEEE